MNLNSPTNPNSLDLPPVVPANKQSLPEVSAPLTSQQEVAEHRPEIMPTSPASGAPQAQAVPVLPSVPPASVAQSPLPASAVSTQPVATPAIADDTDLIEKEWVEKAKEIVNSTRDDPYKQNRELNQMKADYIKKRYSKEVQTGE